jgi:LPS-assembly lipoprotein
MLPRRIVVRTLVGGIFLLASSGCGFRPLYGSRSLGGAQTGSPSIDQQLAAIRIDPIADRRGQQLHNALRDGLNPLGQPITSTHHLTVQLAVRTYGALTRSDLSATRRNVEMTAFYKLTDTADKVALQGSSQITTGYDEFDDPLNDITANESAQERSTIQLAELIKTRLAAYFAQEAK